MFSLFFVLLFIFCLLCLKDCSFVVNLHLIFNSGIYWLFNLDVDYFIVFVFVMLVLCFLFVYNYTGHYFCYNYVGYELNYIICLFVLVMGVLVLSGDFLFTLIFWEYLGVVSYFLILFYCSYLSLRSSVITLVSSRFGDVGLFILFAINSYVFFLNNIVGLMVFFFIIITKSAGFPFISWLLEAMRAPTPVSSLVHSSTLVAAGIWFVIRYDFLFFYDNCFIFTILVLLTIFITGVCCFFFIDLKKIVALSTCNNISWCLFYLLFGDVILSLIQLISHGVSKCLLFILVGDVMSGSSGSQNVNCVYSPRLYGNWGVFSLSCVVLGLSGVPFLGVFFSKHFLLNEFNNIINVFLLVLVFLCVLLSYLYSFRLCYLISKISYSVNIGVLYVFSPSFIIYFWLFVNFFMVCLLNESVFSSLYSCLLLLVFQFISVIASYCFYDSYVFSLWCSSLFGCDNLVCFVYECFFKLLDIFCLFFYRWDKYCINLFIGIGNSVFNIYGLMVLNLVMIFVLFVLVFNMLILL
uniref:NADH:ubiquinone reductase (H(+)-translocating) n=1 Tax=Dipylidium caninum TaxID=66787 RepID=A0A7H9SR21_DIPCN|nr:NADH dehydrogenase subunit 5 [Dipylidium caninum]